jgi:hypothetical protein
VPEARRSDNQHSHSDHQRHDEQKNRLYLRRYLKRVVGEKSVCDSYPARAELTPTNCGKRFSVRSQLRLTDAEAPWPPLLLPKQASCRRPSTFRIAGQVFAPSGDPSMLAAAFLLPLEVKKTAGKKLPAVLTEETEAIFSPALPPLKSED